jgi:hypothetical protein
MTSRNTRRSPAKPRPARMSVARAITKGAPKGSAPARSASIGILAAGGAAAPAPAGPSVLRKPRARGSYGASLRADQKRLAELKVKLGDPEYMNGAILRIATVLSARLTLR